MNAPRGDFRGVLRLREALRRWGRQPVPVVSPETAELREKRGITTIRAAISSAHRERQKRSRLRVLALVAAGVFVSLGGTRLLIDAYEPASVTAASENQETPASLLRAQTPPGARLTLHREGVSRAVEDDMLLEPGDKLAVEAGMSTVEVGRITKAEFAPDTTLVVQKVATDEQTYRLHQGQASFRIDPERRARVMVETEDARVWVTGTRFSVTAGIDSEGSWTRVRVASGSVRVEGASETRSLGPGESWFSRTKAPPAAEETTALDSAKPQAAFRPVAAASKEPPTRPEPTASSTHLAEENRLFQEAVAARNQGNQARCVALTDQLTAKYPKSPLRQEALVLRFRCLKGAGAGTQARRAAARYLSAYPDGFARDEARAIVLQ